MARTIRMPFVVGKWKNLIRKENRKEKRERERVRVRVRESSVYPFPSCPYALAHNINEELKC